MSPRRPRRRARRRSPARPVLLLVAAVVVRRLRSSAGSPRCRGSRRATTPTPTAPWRRRAPSWPTSPTPPSAQVRTLVNDLPAQTRQGLQAGLDGAVQQTAGRVGAGRRWPPTSTPLGSVATEFAAVFAERAQSMSELRAAVDGFLGMQPVPVAGSPAGDIRRHRRRPRLCCRRPRPRTASPPPGALLARSDALYRSVRRVARRRAGSRQAAAVGLGDRPAAVAARARVAAQVDLMATSPTLARRTTWSCAPCGWTPGPADAAGRAAERVGPQPDPQFGVTVVLANQGSVGRAARLGPLHPGEPVVGRHGKPHVETTALGSGRLGDAAAR